MTTPQSKIYLSAADRNLETYLDEGAFERSLLLDLLFQSGVLVPDIFFFISDGIARHLHESRLTLLEAGLQSGDVVPSFRNRNTSDFANALHIVKGAGDKTRAILGIRDDADNTARRLDTALRGATKFAPTYWPEWNVGCCFQKRIEQLLSGSAVPRLPADEDFLRDRLAEIWDYTHIWRTDCVRQAVEDTVQLAGKGLQRGLLITAIGRALGLVTGNAKLHDVSELMNPALPPDDLNALHYFCRWINDIYQYNQACELGAIPSFPQYEPLAGVFANEVFVREASRPAGTTDRAQISVQVPMPEPSALSQVHPADLMKIKNDVGTGYFTALEAWRAPSVDKSTATLEQDVERALREYGSAFVHAVNRRGQTRVGVIEALLSRANGMDPILPLTLGNTAALAASQASPALGVLMAVGTNSYAVYRWWCRRPHTVEVHLQRGALPSAAAKNLDITLSDRQRSLGLSKTDREGTEAPDSRPHRPM